MIRQILGSRVVLVHQQARYKNIQSFLCIHESLNEQAQLEAIAKFKASQKKYKLTNQQVIHATQAINLYRLSQAKHNFPNNQSLSSHQRSLFTIYQENCFFGLGKSLEETGKILSYRYPDLESKPNTERVSALKELEHIFLKMSTPTSDQDYEEILSRVEQMKYTEQYGEEYAKLLHDSLDKIITEYAQNTTYQGLLKTIVEQGLGIKYPQVYIEDKTVELSALTQQREIQELMKGFTEEDQFYAQDVNLADFNSLQNEQIQGARSEGKYQNNYNEKGQKIIFEAEVPNYHVLRYQILAAVFGLYFAYLLYRGDAMYKTIILVPIITSGFFFMQQYHSAHRALPIVKQILKSQDKSYEFLIERNRIISRIENVAAQNFIIQNSSRKFFDFDFGFVSVDGRVCTINDQAAILPYYFTGNARDVK